VYIIVEKNTPLTPLKRGIKKTPEIYPLDKEKNQKYYLIIFIYVCGIFWRAKK